MAKRRKTSRRKAWSFPALPNLGKPERLDLLALAPIAPFVILAQQVSRWLWYVIFYNPEKAARDKRRKAKA